MNLSSFPEREVEKITLSQVYFPVIEIIVGILLILSRIKILTIDIYYRFNIRITILSRP